MRVHEDNNDGKTVFCGNLSEDATEDILYELFQQAGPVDCIRRPQDPSGRPKPFAFIIYKHESSIPYALHIFRGIKLFKRVLNLNSRSTLRHVPVLDTHVTEFTDPRAQIGLREMIPQDQSRSYQDRREDHRSENGRRKEHSQSKHSHREHRSNVPASWADLRGKSLVSGNRSDSQHYSDRQRESSSGAQMMPDFNALLQMGQQMMLSSGMMGMQGLPFPLMGGPSQMVSGLGGYNMLPSMQGRMDGGERHSPERDRRRYDHHRDRRESRRDHPYYNRERRDHEDNHGRHNRGYSSSRSSHDRERRDRKSR